MKRNRLIPILRSRQTPIFQSPILMLIIMIAAVFVSETTVMLWLQRLPHSLDWIEPFLDSTLLIVILFPILYFFVFHQSRVRIIEISKAKNQLEIQIGECNQAQKTLKESENRLRLLSYQLLNAQENERRRISREIHDELGQALATLKIRIGFIEKKFHENPAELKQECEQALKFLDEVIENTRRFSKDLSPQVLEYFGLTTALKRLINDFAKDYGIGVTPEIDNIDHFFSQDAQTAIYRIVQEALNNAGRHAQAAHFSLIMKRENGFVSFMIEDDGKGFDVKQTILGDARSKGMGLATMNERVRMLGGMLDLWSREGEGTRITFSIPIPEQGSA